MNNDVKSASRVLDLLELLALEQQGRSLTSIAERLGLPKSSTLGLLRTLVGRGYVAREPDDRYRLCNAFRAEGFARHGRLLGVAPAIMRKMADELGETVILGGLASAGTVRLLAKEVAGRDIRFDIELSRQLPAYCTAIGRILIAQLGDDEARDILGAAPRKGPTSSTITDKAALWDRIEQARSTGVAIVEEEFALGGTGVATLIPGSAGNPKAALNIGCITARFHERREEIVAALRRGAEEIGAALKDAAT